MISTKEKVVLDLMGNGPGEKDWQIYSGKRGNQEELHKDYWGIFHERSTVSWELKMELIDRMPT